MREPTPPCVHPVCSKQAGYEVTRPGRTWFVCGAVHLKWILDMILSSSPEHTADIRFRRFRPVRPNPQSNRVYVTMALDVDEEMWNRDNGTNSETWREDVVSYLRTNLASNLLTDDGTWKNVEVK